MENSKTKLEVALALSSEILNDIENSQIQFEQILLKCKRLARLRDDFDSINWFTAELSGYGSEITIPGISRNDLERYAVMSGRFTVNINPENKKEEYKYFTASVSEIEADINSNTVVLENLRPPQQFTPAIYKHSGYLFGNPTSTETVIEKY